jgi:DNA-binding PadR family transcriptional regulator
MQKEEGQKEGRKKKTDILQGMLDMMILRMLRQGPLNGWDIMNRI